MTKKWYDIEAQRSGSTNTIYTSEWASDPSDAIDKFLNGRLAPNGWRYVKVGMIMFYGLAPEEYK